MRKGSWVRLYSRAGTRWRPSASFNIHRVAPTPVRNELCHQFGVAGHVSVCAAQEAWPRRMRSLPLVLRTPTIVRMDFSRWQRQLRTTVGATRFRIPHSAFRIPHSAFRNPNSAFNHIISVGSTSTVQMISLGGLKPVLARSTTCRKKSSLAAWR